MSDTVYLHVQFQPDTAKQIIFTEITFLKMIQRFVFYLWLAGLVSSLKFFEEENLTHEEFEKYPIVSSTKRESETCEEVMEVEEVRDVKGEEISRLSIIDTSNLHTVLEDSKSKGQLEVWHR